jgi:membrane-bound lytic murein transglycosylase A
MSRARIRAVAFLCVAAAVVAGCRTPPRTPAPAPTPTPAVLHLSAAPFAALPQWGASDMRPALAAFLRSCAALMDRANDSPLGGAGYAGTIGDWRGPCAEGARVPNGDPRAAQTYFENTFVAYAVKSEPASDGLFTGYYEPLLRGSRMQHDQYQTPLYALPPGYEVPRVPRAEIDKNGAALPVLAYVDDKIDAFFLHIQGSGRVQLDDGTMIRAAYAGQNGYPYTAIGAILLGRGEIPREKMSMQAIRAWMLAHPDEADALMQTNESYVFFIEKPLANPNYGAEGSGKSALEPHASIAVDRSIHPLGLPVWIETTAPVLGADAVTPMHKLFIAQDTGGAIKGPVRADIYWGFGPEAAELAGRMKSQGRIAVLLPKAVAARLGSRAAIPLR